MYDCYRSGTVEGRDSFPRLWIAGENLLYLTGWTLAGCLVWPVQLTGWPVATLAWIIIVLALQILLKKHFCTGCYYYGKSCHLGWGRISAALFRQDTGNPRMGMVLAVPMYMLSPPLVIAAAIIIGLRWPVNTGHWFVLGAFVALTVFSFPLRTKSCRQCKMRAVCPGSASKPKSSGGIS
jgi:hypothetical protein